MDFNESASNNTNTTQQQDSLVVGNESITSAIILLPVLLYCAASYLYLLRGLVKKKIWNQLPFYAAFIALGISDCFILFRFIIVQCLFKLSMVKVTASSPYFFQLCLALIERVYALSYNYSSCMLGIMAVTRTVAITKPITYKQRLDKASGRIVVIGCGLVALVPCLLGLVSITPLGFVDYSAFEFVVVVQSPFHVSMETFVLVETLLYVFLPLLVGGIIPMVLYPFMAYKLRSPTTNNLLNSSQKQIESKFFAIGLTLSLAYLIPSIMIVILTMGFYAETGFWVNLSVNIAFAFDALIPATNPFIYWMFDSTIKKEIPIPIWVPFMKKSTTVVPVTAVIAASQPKTPPIQLLSADQI